MTQLEKLASLRSDMRDQGIDAYIIPSSDPHISEYLPDRYKCIAWTSGFTGSAGTLVITQDFAGLWTDSRYFFQANEQLAGSGFELVKLKTQGAAEYAVWLSHCLSAGQKVAFDGNLASVAITESVQNTLLPLGIIVDGHVDLLSNIWLDRPSLPTGEAYLIDETITGASTSTKLNQIKSKLAEKHADSHLISSLDDLAWALNIRGNDVPCNPVVLGFLLITKEENILFMDTAKLTNSSIDSLAASSVQVQPYELLFERLKTLEATRILLDPKRTCFAVYDSIPPGIQILNDINPSTSLKSTKNDVEVNNSRNAMIKDGVALTRFFKWIEENVASGQHSEISIAEKVHQLRAALPGFVDVSFDTIAGYKEHGALPHYKATKASNAILKSEGLLLVDSGGQYQDGTTDITRVISLGNMTSEEQQDYTLVLKAMIEGSMAIFPKGTRGYQIDALTRQPMWQALRNYGHGTGHGVGYFLNVHEGPQVFNPSAVDVVIEEGMITSMEPGLYREGQYGIRIENLLLTIPYESNYFADFLAFETLTVCYIDTDLVDKSYLEQKHIDWLNNYNQWVFDQLQNQLTDEEKEWLGKKTKAI